MFCCRFKTPEAAAEFKKHMDEAIRNAVAPQSSTPMTTPATQSTGNTIPVTQPLAASTKPTQTPTSVPTQPQTTVPTTQSSTQATAAAKDETDNKQSLAEMFKPKDGEWTCEGCYCKNSASMKVRYEKILTKT